MSNIRTIPGWQEMTGDQLLAFSLAHPNTAKPVRSADLQKWLRLNRLSWFDLDGKWVGLLADIARNPDTPAEKRSQMEGLLSQFREDSAAPIETDSNEYAGLLAWLLENITLPNNEIAKFYELGGGRMYPLFASAEQAEEAKAAAIAVDTFRASQKAAKEILQTAIAQADVARFAAEQAGQLGPECNAAWLAKVNEVLG